MKKILTVAILFTLMFSAFAERSWEIPSWTMPGSSKCDDGWTCGFDKNCVVRWTNLEYWSRHDGGIIVDIDEVHRQDSTEAEYWLVIYDGSTGVLSEVERKNITGCSQEYLDEVLYNLRDNKKALEKLETEKLEVKDFEFENVTTWDNADIQTYYKDEQKWYEKVIDVIVFWD